MADTPQKGGTLKIGRYADVVSFDPVFRHGQHVDLG